MAENNEIMIVDENSLRNKIYTIRGQQVMLDFELAQIYGYTTARFNEQVKNNIAKFDPDFMFQLTREEFDDLMSKKSTSSWGGRRKLPYVFTEQGLYMLMTILRGELATIQSKALIRLFKSMKDYLIENQPLLTQKNYFALVDTVESHSREIRALAQDVQEIKENMVTRADLSDFMKLFDQGASKEEILILDGEPFKADVAYQSIYKKARHKIAMVDDYISVKTLQHLAHAKPTVVITVISDNKAKPPLRFTEFNDFVKENPGRNITFLKSQNRAHDRYIALDEGTKEMKVYHCGASSKDAGRKVTTITRIADVDDYKNTIRQLLGNPSLTLK
ncbi:MAG: ORF6N domain-containing protein [Lachnospiraceae bacterium]|nr:ORF6N domain-containing protein [Lachnospiraceae bacterium]